jgi:hypothetical protein
MNAKELGGVSRSYISSEYIANSKSSQGRAAHSFGSSIRPKLKHVTGPDGNAVAALHT